MFKISQIIVMPLVAFFIVACGSDRAGNDVNGSNNRTGVLGVSTFAPKAMDDNVSTGYNETILIDILENDTLDDKSIIRLSTLPVYGTAELKDNKVLYTPNRDFIGLDGFSYLIRNGLKEEDSAKVRISVGIGRDSDGDGISDKDELALGTDPESSDSDGDGLTDGEEFYLYHTNATNPDSDNDGLTDGDEIRIYDTNATNPDSDGDGLIDGDEINIYDTNATNPDSDNDGLTDIDEINKYDTNATNPDTDGDCLLDSFEILNYETNASNPDTDGDHVPDGIEIYSYSNDEIDKSCVDSPETLDDGASPTPAKDNIPILGDVINALDPNNDSDGDGQVNSFENNCSEGDALDATKQCPYFSETEDATEMSQLGYAYVPGGFDVDGDGVNETGFWMSRYQARRTDNFILVEEVINTVGIIDEYISDKFKVVNRNTTVLAYSQSELTPNNTVAGSELLFDEKQAKENKRISNLPAYLAEVSMSKHKLIKSNGEILDLNVTIPTHKQYIHVKKLLDADKANGGDGRHIRNGLLGIEPKLPILKYTIVIDEFGKNKKEYVRNLVQLKTVTEDETTSTFNVNDDIPKWWVVDETKVKILLDGATTIHDLGFGIGASNDPYAVIIRGGDILDLTLSVSGADTDGESDSAGVSFRAATPYFK